MGAKVIEFHKTYKDNEMDWNVVSSTLEVEDTTFESRGDGMYTEKRKNIATEIFLIVGITYNKYTYLTHHSLSSSL